MADAVVVPGRLFGPGSPLPMYTGDVAERRGATLHRHEWSTLSPDPFQPPIERWVVDEVTPVLNVPWITAALGRATAPFMLVGGTADKLWDGDLARRLTPHVFEVADADHGMYVPGPLTDSIAVLSRMVFAVDEFLTEIDWPS